MYLKAALASMLFFPIAATQVAEYPLVTFTRREIATTQSYHPSAGCVPDRETAIAIAVAIFKPVYGEAEVNSSRP